MFKQTFVSSLLFAAALARGTGDGTSSENATEVYMIGNNTNNVDTYVNTWNELGADGKTLVIQGETFASGFE